MNDALIRGRCEGINKTIELICRKTGIEVPKFGTPSQRRKALLEILSARVSKN